jgi:RNA-binding protein Nova
MATDAGGDSAGVHRVGTPGERLDDGRGASGDEEDGDVGGGGEYASVDDGGFTLKFLISPSAAGSVIGKGGATINEFQALTGARIQLSRNREVFPGTNDRVVILNGDLNAILQVLHLIMNQLLTDGEGIDRMGMPQVVLVVPNSSCGCIIGKGGSKIRSFVEDSQADIKLSNQDRMLPGCNDRTLTITGTIESVLRGVALVATTLCEDPTYASLIHRQSTYSVQAPIAHPNASRRSADHGRRRPGLKGDETSVLVTIPDSLIGAILGRAGRTIAEIQVASGCRIKVSDRDDFFEGTQNRKVIITGSPDGVQMANFLLTQKLSSITSSLTHDSAQGALL